jgi:origin recognition complex subunit 5
MFSSLGIIYKRLSRNSYLEEGNDVAETESDDVTDETDKRMTKKRGKNQYNVYNNSDGGSSSGDNHRHNNNNQHNKKNHLILKNNIATKNDDKYRHVKTPRPGVIRGLTPGEAASSPWCCITCGHNNDAPGRVRGVTCNECAAPRLFKRRKVIESPTYSGFVNVGNIQIDLSWSWQKIWAALKSEGGWTWDKSNSLASSYIYLMPGVKKRTGVPGVNMFESYREVMKFLKITQENASRMGPCGEKNGVTSDEDEDFEETEPPITPDNAIAKQNNVTDPNKAKNVASVDHAIDYDIIDLNDSWANIYYLLKQCGWRHCRAAASDLVHTFYYIAPGAPPKRRCVFGKNIFRNQDEVKAYVKKKQHHVIAKNDVVAEDEDVVIEAEDEDVVSEEEDEEEDSSGKYSMINVDDSWSNIYYLLKQGGWRHVSGDNFEPYFYLKPGYKKSTAVFGKEIFRNPGAVLEYIRKAKNLRSSIGTCIHCETKVFADLSTHQSHCKEYIDYEIEREKEARRLMVEKEKKVQQERRKQQQEKAHKQFLKKQQIIAIELKQKQFEDAKREREELAKKKRERKMEIEPRKREERERAREKKMERQKQKKEREKELRRQKKEREKERQRQKKEREKERRRQKQEILKEKIRKQKQIEKEKKQKQKQEEMEARQKEIARKRKKDEDLKLTQELEKQRLLVEKKLLEEAAKKKENDKLNALKSTRQKQREKAKLLKEQESKKLGIKSYGSYVKSKKNIFDLNDSFGNIWFLLKQDGWRYASGNAIYSWFYLKPGVTKRTGKLGVDMFGTEQDVIDHCKMLGMHGQKLYLESSTSSESDDKDENENSITVEDPCDVVAEVPNVVMAVAKKNKQQRKSGSGKTASRKSSQLPFNGTQNKNSKSTGISGHTRTKKKSLMSTSNAEIAEKAMMYLYKSNFNLSQPWRDLWEDLTIVGWKWHVGVGDFKYMYLEPGTTIGEGKLGVDMFCSEKDVTEHLRRSFFQLAVKHGDDEERYDSHTITSENELDLSEPWNNIWYLLKQGGWTWASGDMFNPYYYLKPLVANKGSGILGVNMFACPADVIKHLKANNVVGNNFDGATSSVVDGNAGNMLSVVEDDGVIENANENTTQYLNAGGLDETSSIDRSLGTTYDPLDLLCGRWPGRSEVIQKLASLVGEADDWALPLILVTGGAATGKTMLVQDFFSLMNVNYVYVDCANIHRARDLFEHILGQLVSNNTSNASAVDGMQWDSDGEDKDENDRPIVQSFGNGQMPLTSSGSSNTNDFGNNDMINGENTSKSSTSHMDNVENNHSNNNNTGNLPDAETSRKYRCDKTSTFLQLLKQLVNIDIPSYLIFDNAEKLQNLDGSILPIFSRIQEASDCNVGVVMITQTAWESFEADTAGSVPLTLHIKPNSSTQIIKLVSQECPPGDNERLFQNFVRDIHSVFRSMVNDVRELRYVVQLLFPKFRELSSKQTSQARLDGSANHYVGLAKIQRMMQPLYRMVQRRLLLHDITDMEINQFFEKEIRQYSEIDAEKNMETSGNSLSSNLASNNNAAALNNSNLSEGKTPSSSSVLVSRTNESSSEGSRRIKALSLAIELPMLTKFLLISAYLASHNPADTDVKIFTHHRSGRRKRRRSHQSTVSSRTSTRDKLKFPKQFPTERMYAIFSSLVSEMLGIGDAARACTIDLNAQVTSLVHLNLLVQTSSFGDLDQIRLRCNVDKDIVEIICKQIGLNLHKYLQV